MLFIKCGKKMFDPRAVTTVERNYDYDTETGNSVLVSTPGSLLTFWDDEAEAVWDYFLGLPTRDLMRPDEAEVPEAGAPNHSLGEC